MFLNIAAKYDGNLELNLWHDRLVDHECPCARMTQLKDVTSVTEAQNFIKTMRTLGMRAEPRQSGGHERMNERDKTPDSAKKCRVPAAHPSGESL